MRRILAYRFVIYKPVMYSKYNDSSIKINNKLPEYFESSSINLNMISCWWDSNKYVENENRKNDNIVCALCIDIKDVRSIFILGNFLAKIYILITKLIINDANIGV